MYLMEDQMESEEVMLSIMLQPELLEVLEIALQHLLPISNMEDYFRWILPMPLRLIYLQLLFLQAQAH
jgi:hypothetical protein